MLFEIFLIILFISICNFKSCMITCGKFVNFNTQAFLRDKEYKEIGCFLYFMATIKSI